MMVDPFAPAGAVRLRPGRHASLLRHHPWVYRGALAEPLAAGLALVEVLAANGRPLGVALPGGSGGSLALRMVSFGGGEWSARALRSRLREAVALRQRLGLDSDAVRLVHAEGDGLPGLVVDRYADAAVVEVHEPAWEPLLAPVIEVLSGELGCTCVLLRRAFRDDARVEALVGEVPASPVAVREGRLRLSVDLVGGQKTGLFLDQRDSRRRIGELARGCTVLNLFAYSGGFAVAALAGGAARAVNVEASAPARELAIATYRLNDLVWRDDDYLLGDAFRLSRDLVAGGESFDLVVVDPPAFVKRQGQLEGGLRGYKDINLQALRLVARGGLMLTCSCSALVDDAAFDRTLAAAATDAGRTVRVLERRGAGADHPVSVACPETRHLKALLCAVS
jgi:23S rRNA (cytosine1962-C5)-methyltransferase